MSHRSIHGRQADDGCRDFRQTRVGRRAFLQAGGLSALGLGLPQLWSGQQAWAEGLPAAGGRARSCIFLFMWGGPSQLDTFDMKPDAPDEVRGEFQPISTSVPGVQICEHFSKLAPWMDRVAIVRSLNHTDPAHLSSAHATLTGNWAPVINSDAEPPGPRDTPHIGSMLARINEQQIGAQRKTSLPAFVTLPWIALHPAAPGGRAPGQNAGWLGRRYDPFVVGGDPSEDAWNVDELAPVEGLSIDRIADRRALLNGIGAQRRALERAAERDFGNLQQKAFNLLASPQARSSFDLHAETDETRDRYGRNIHGQCVLLARRLVENGVPLVSVNWHNDGRNFWDTHGNNFNRLKNDLIPPADQALTALLEDLEQSGRLDETLVVWVGEFGRKPQITAGNAGREHWPFCYSGLLAGGGISGGAVYGTSDAQAAHPASDPASPLDFAATIYRALGIDPEATVQDALGRPVRISTGQAIEPLFA